jgi:hypothetical protein
MSDVAHGSPSFRFNLVPRRSEMKNVMSVAVALGLSLLLTPMANAQYRGAVRPPAVRPVAPLPKPIAPVVAPKSIAPAPKAAISAPKSSTVNPKAPSAAARSTTPAHVQGNSLSSNKPQHLYGIFGTNTNTGKTTLHKFGVSGGTSRSGSQLPSPMQRSTLSPTRDYSNRALQQVNQLNKQAQTTGQPIKYSTRNLQSLSSQSSISSTARQSIIAAEKQAVTKFSVNRGDKPVGNALPNPAPFSRIK